MGRAQPETGLKHVAGGVYIDSVIGSDRRLRQLTPFHVSDAHDRPLDLPHRLSLPHVAGTPHP